MVSFVCNYCQETLKKPKLVPHTYRCYNANFTCIDCNTDFQGTEYTSHTSCISEAQKYQGSLYKGPKAQNKANNGNFGAGKKTPVTPEAPKPNNKRVFDESPVSTEEKTSKAKLIESKDNSSKSASIDLASVTSSTIEEILSKKPKIHFSKLKSKVLKKIAKKNSNTTEEELSSIIEEEIMNLIRKDKFSIAL